jgi:hypothetical protein
MELFYSARNKKEPLQRQAFIDRFKVVHLDQNTSEQRLALIVE